MEGLILNDHLLSACYTPKDETTVELGSIHERITKKAVELLSKCMLDWDDLELQALKECVKTLALGTLVTHDE